MRLLGLTKNRLFIAKLVGQLFAGKQWGVSNKSTVTLPLAYTKYYCVAMSTNWGYAAVKTTNLTTLTFVDGHAADDFRYIVVGI